MKVIWMIVVILSGGGSGVVTFETGLKYEQHRHCTDGVKRITRGNDAFDKAVITKNSRLYMICIPRSEEYAEHLSGKANQLILQPATPSTGKTVPAPQN